MSEKVNFSKYLEIRSKAPSIFDLKRDKDAFALTDDVLEFSDDENFDEISKNEKNIKNVKKLSVPLDLKVLSNLTQDDELSNTVKVVADEICQICLTNFSDDNNPLIKCQGFCSSLVHKNCFGLKYLSSLNPLFVCDGCKCTKNQGNLQTCSLCCSKGGLMKKSIDGRFQHIICVIFCNELTVDENMCPNNLNDLNPDRNILICRICSKQGGACIQCSFGKCLVSTHPYCALVDNVLLVIRSKSTKLKKINSSSQQGKSDERFEYEMYCPQHECFCSKEGIVSSNRKELLSQYSNSTESITSSVKSSSYSLNTTNNLIDSAEKPCNKSTHRSIITRKLRRYRIFNKNNRKNECLYFIFKLY
jgi:hypothetical protein